MERPIIYIPGFPWVKYQSLSEVEAIRTRLKERGARPVPDKGQLFKKAFENLAIAAYDTLHPNAAFLELEAIIGDSIVRSPLLIGSSLGGFWAYFLARKFSLKCLLLNPCMHPEITLSAHIGSVVNIFSGEIQYLSENDLASYAAYEFPGVAECVVLHDKGDELIPYTNSVKYFDHGERVVLYEGGSHQFEHLGSAIEEICSLQTLNGHPSPNRYSAERMNVPTYLPGFIGGEL